MTKIKRVAYHIWSPKEVALLRRAYPHISTGKLAAHLGLTITQVLRKASTLGLRKSTGYRRSPQSSCFKPGNQKGLATQFKKGNTPFNKGKHHNAGGRSVEARFKVGHVPHNTVPIGSMVTDTYGYLVQKATDKRNGCNWRPVHLLIWEEAHGPVPAGHVIMFKDGDKRHVALNNLACISQTENMRRNSIHRYPPELERTIRTAAKLRKTIKEKRQ